MPKRKRRRTPYMLPSTSMRRKGRKGRYGRPMPGRHWDKYGKVEQ